MNIVTHTDLDGICCAALFIRKYGSQIKIIFATVNEARRISEENFDADYTCDLPKVNNSINIDHHKSNYEDLIITGRLSAKDVIDPSAPSATDLVYNVLGFSDQEDTIASEIKELGHLADTANLPEYYKQLDIVLNLNSDNKEFLRELSEILAKEGRNILESDWLIRKSKESNSIFSDTLAKIHSFLRNQTQLPQILILDTRNFIPSKLAKEVIKPVFERGVLVVAVIYSKSIDEPVRVSFRVSKSVQDADRYDVASVAQIFGGGGHKMAAACTPDQSDIPDRLLKELQKISRKGDSIEYINLS